MKNKILSIVIIILAMTGITIQYSQQTSDFYRFNFFTYYTIQTNILVVLVCIYGLIKNRKGKIYNIILTGVTVYISITGLVFHLLLNDVYQPSGINGFANHCVHTFVPILTLVLWFINSNKIIIKRTNLLYFSVYPFIFLASSLIRGHFKGYYPYWFLNPTWKGVGSYFGVARISFLILLGFIVLGYTVVTINNRLVRKKL